MKQEDSLTRLAAPLGLPALPCETVCLEGRKCPDLLSSPDALRATRRPITFDIAH